MVTRGKQETVEASSFHSPNRAKQLIDFAGMRFKDGARPTDIDGFNGEHLSASIDFKDGTKGFIFYEVKYMDEDLGTGQKRHMVALVDNLMPTSLAVHLSHSVHDTDKNVMLKDCIVQKMYLKGEPCWSDRYKGMTALEITEKFIQKYCPEYLLGDDDD